MIIKTKKPKNEVKFKIQLTYKELKILYSITHERIEEPEQYEFLENLKTLLAPVIRNYKSIIEEFDDNSN